MGGAWSEIASTLEPAPPQRLSFFDLVKFLDSEDDGIRCLCQRFRSDCEWDVEVDDLVFFELPRYVRLAHQKLGNQRDEGSEQRAYEAARDRLITMKLVVRRAERAEVPPPVPYEMDDPIVQATFRRMSEVKTKIDEFEKGIQQIESDVRDASFKDMKKMHEKILRGHEICLRHVYNGDADKAKMAHEKACAYRSELLDKTMENDAAGRMVWTVSSAAGKKHQETAKAGEAVKQFADYVQGLYKYETEVMRQMSTGKLDRLLFREHIKELEAERVKCKEEHLGSVKK